MAGHRGLGGVFQTMEPQISKSERQRANRLYYLSRGMCPRCGGANKVVEDRVLCVECQIKKDTEQKERRNRWKEQGLCIRCGREPAKGKSECQKCLDDRKAKQISARSSKKRRDKLREMGFCTVCGKTWAEPGHVRCTACLIKHRAETTTESQRASAKARRQARIDAGLCIDCGEPTDRPGKQRCTACTVARRDSTRKYAIKKRMEREAEQARRATNWTRSE